MKMCISFCVYFLYVCALCMHVQVCEVCIHVPNVCACLHQVVRLQNSCAAIHGLPLHCVPLPYPPPFCSQPVPQEAGPHQSEMPVRDLVRWAAWRCGFPHQAVGEVVMGDSQGGGGFLSAISA